ncbi:DUF397 domain-containing protein [Actinophytocola xanthii]|uniref:DUF397 domain-containing protein n=1 Tax=Actinophytocola xanthii TaxID=1912961 RepID=A0A1Q8CLW3_9PSEU|nr:DUF397 domain-containing protein [Actinophytocola xanthii]OLF15347.1 hypothetical protein BU204_22135 [Actinophytocola xanthii]
MTSWRKSTRTNTGNCVEVRNDLAALRDSKDRDGGSLAAGSLRSFLRAVKSGRFDR